MAVTVDLNGRVALVTGAGAGIGRAIARWLAMAGCTVVVNDLDGTRVASTVSHLEEAGLEATAAVGDLRREEEVADVLGEVRARHGRLDVAVNNVGMTAGRPAGPFVTTPLADAEAVIAQNLGVTYRCCLAEAAMMVAQGGGGVILNVTSGESRRPARGLAAYGAAKAAINHLTTTLAAELGPEGIRVNAMAPGTTYTEEVRRAVDPEAFEALAASTPLGVVCEPDELGRLAVFLCSELARTITGQTILADAGAHLGRSTLALRDAPR